MLLDQAPSAVDKPLHSPAPETIVTVVAVFVAVLPNAVFPACIIILMNLFPRWGDKFWDSERSFAFNLKPQWAPSCFR